MSKNDIVDLCVIGGGINGAGIARDAAGRGLSVILCEQGDLAQGTSSRSGKLVHGGLRYLEYCEFRLVREALIEREVLLNAAPHIIWPLRFVLPHSPGDRPAWLVRAGLFLYDHLGGRKKLPGTRSLDLARNPEGAPIKDEYRRAFEYSDCWVDDARLVVLNAVDAAQRGAEVLTRTACVKARREGGVWRVELRDARNGSTRTVSARALVNAAGPWVTDVIGRAGAESTRKVRLVKGSHIVTPKFWDGPHSYLVQNHDKRVIFINAYEGDKALIGTTDVSWDGEPENVTISSEEIDYLLSAVNRYFKHPLRRQDIVQTFSGVRPLYDDGKGNPSAVTRDYVLDLDDSGGVPLLNVFGGKITTFRKLAEHALQRLRPTFPQMDDDWTARATLPGGDIEGADVPRFMARLQSQYGWLPRDLMRYYTQTYGTRTAQIIGGATSLAGLGEQFGPNFYEAEARYLMLHEWAETVADIVTRRTKHGLHMSAAQTAAFRTWMDGLIRKFA